LALVIRIATQGDVRLSAFTAKVARSDRHAEKQADHE